MRQALTAKPGWCKPAQGLCRKIPPELQPEHRNPASKEDGIAPRYTEREYSNETCLRIRRSAGLVTGSRVVPREFVSRP